ncbi:T9SS type A sorting domain-containing protein [bacterium]|nr:T9SS type A sorting domain-containing protein [bacterium]
MKKSVFRFHSLIVIMSAIFFLVAGWTSASAERRQPDDWGVTWEGDYYRYYEPERMQLRWPYVYVSDTQGFLMYKFDVPDNAPATITLLDRNPNLTTDYSFDATDDGLIYAGVRPYLYVLQRENDSLHQVGICYDSTGVWYSEISGDSLVVNNDGIFSLRDPSHPRMIWEADTSFYSCMSIVGNTLFARRVEEFEQVCVYDIADPTAPVLVDSIEGYYSEPHINQAVTLNNTTMYLSRHWREGYSLNFAQVDEEGQYSNSYRWSYWDVTYRHNPHTLHGIGVYDDSLFIATNLDDQGEYGERLYFFNPTLLPEDPLVEIVDLPDWIWGANLSGFAVAFDSTFMLISSTPSPPSRLLDISDPHDPVIVWEHPRLASTSYRFDYMDENESGFLTEISGNYADEADLDEGLYLLDLWTDGAPETIVSFPQSIGDGRDYQLCDNLLLKKPYDSSLPTELYSFSPEGDAQHLYDMPLDPGWRYDSYEELFRLQLDYYTVAYSDSSVHIIRLDDTGPELIQTFEVETGWPQANVYDPYLYITTSIFLSQDRVWQYALVDGLFQLVDQDSCADAQNMIAGNRNWFGFDSYLFRVTPAGLEHHYTFPYVPNEELPHIVYITDDYLVLSQNRYYNGMYIYALSTEEEPRLVGHIDGDGIPTMRDHTLWLLDSYHKRMTHFELNGESGLNEPQSWTGTPLPAGYSLSNAWPNPFNASARITVTVPNRGDVTLSLYNLLGREVTRLSSGVLPAGNHSFRINGQTLSSGVYFVQLSTVSTTQTRKVVLLK